MSEISPFYLAIPESQLEDLRFRLEWTRWPEKEPVPDNSQGVRLAKMQELCAYWLDTYDWRRCEALLNGFGQYRTVIDGLGIHFLHVRSERPDAIPVIMTHGWPGSVVEFLKVIRPLTVGETGGPAFHLVIPSLPGYGFSDRPSEPGWSIERTARAWIVLMERLGYDRFIAQGGDWGGAVSSAIGRLAPPACLGLHLNMPVGLPTDEQKLDMTDDERAAQAALAAYHEHDSGYAKQQSTRPQTLGYGLADSPAGQAAWIYEKFQNWTDNDGDVESVLSKDEILDNIMLYWLPNTSASSGRMYWENYAMTFQKREIDVPVGCTRFPREIYSPSRRWSENSYRQLVYWNEAERGGHFAAFEQPEIFVRELRASAAALSKQWPA